MVPSAPRPAASLPPEARPPLEPPFQSLREANFLLRGRWRRELERFDLSYSDYVVLELCGRGPARASEVARAIGLTAAGTTDALDRLETRRLVRRVADRRDRRAVQVRLTPTGRRLLGRTRTAKRAFLRYLRDALSPEERRALAEGLGALTRALRGSARGG